MLHIRRRIVLSRRTYTDSSMNLYPQDEEFTAAQAAEITANTAKVTANTANVTAAGALMDSELTEIAAVKALTGTNTGDEVAASDSVAGVIKAASVTQTNTGTATDSAVTPAGLAGSTLYGQVASNAATLALLTARQTNGHLMLLNSSDQLIDSGTMTDITNWDTPTLIGSDYTVTTSTGIVEINTTGTYAISYTITGLNQAAGRAGLEVQIQVDTGAGYVDEDQTLTGGYARFDGVQQYATGSLASYIRAMTDGDKLKLQAAQTTNNFDINGHLSIVRIDD
jgi:hypothetical protein